MSIVVFIAEFLHFLTLSMLNITHNSRFHILVHFLFDINSMLLLLLHQYRCSSQYNIETSHRSIHFYPLVHKSRYRMSSSSIFNQRMMKEQKMFMFDPPPGLHSPSCLRIGVFVWPVNESNREYHCGTFHPLCLSHPYIIRILTTRASFVLTC